MYLPKRTWIVPAVWLLLWAYIYGWLIRQFGFESPVCWIDSLVSNALLVLIGSGVIFTVRYYRPSYSKWYIYVAGIIGSAVLWSWVSRLILLNLLTNQITYHEFLIKTYPLKIVIGVLFIGLFTMFGWILSTIQDRQHEEKRREEVTRMMQEAELVNLRQQLQPHFIFNTLNSVSSLVNIDQTKATTMIHQLSDFLRGTLKREEKVATPLQQELEHLQLYLEIEKVRFGNRLKSSIETDAQTLSMQIPPLTLQPLVENAIKFGLYDTLEAVDIRISSSINNGNLVIQIMNPFDPETRDALEGTGFGLSSVQRRLYILFGRNDLLLTTINNNIFTATLIIPQTL